MPMEATVTASNVHNKTHKVVPGIKPVHENIGSSFWMYRSLVSRALVSGDPVSSKTAEAILPELHKRFQSYWLQSFAPGVADGYRLGGDKLTDEFIQAAAGKQAGLVGKQINGVSDRAFIEGYNAAVNKGWERAVAWERVSKAYGVDPAQMRKWITGYPSDGYHPGAIPEVSQRQLDKMLLDRAERIAGHESWNAYQMGKLSEVIERQKDGLFIDGIEKVWTTAGDELTCESCGPLDGETIAPSEPFFTDFGEMYAPPMHINCRCDLEIHIPVMNVVTKRMGDDEYDRDSSGKFASQEKRGFKAQKKKNTGAGLPFVIESDENPWPETDFVATPREGDTLGEDIKPADLKSEAEEIAGKFKEEEPNDNLDKLPYTSKQEKHNAKIEREDRIRQKAEESYVAEMQRLADEAASREKVKEKVLEEQDFIEEVEDLTAEAAQAKENARIASYADSNKHAQKNQSRVAVFDVPVGEETFILGAEDFHVRGEDGPLFITDIEQDGTFRVSDDLFGTFTEASVRQQMLRNRENISEVEEPDEKEYNSGEVSGTKRRGVESVLPDGVYVQVHFPDSKTRAKAVRSGGQTAYMLPRGTYRIVGDTELRPMEAARWARTGELSSPNFNYSENPEDSLYSIDDVEDDFNQSESDRQTRGEQAEPLKNAEGVNGEYLSSDDRDELSEQESFEAALFGDDKEFEDDIAAKWLADNSAVPDQMPASPTSTQEERDTILGAGDTARIIQIEYVGPE